jgi:NAD(P)-dependent dehydrogenase (short-subunit alcohol dehydrogenase family)
MATVLITGTSQGIGLATALELGRAGHTVYATMRNPARAPELGAQVSKEGLTVSILTMDVDSDRSVEDCFAAIHGQGKNIDVLINNAGIERHGSVEELPMADFRAAMETNYFGALRCIRQVVPRMRTRRSGWIVNVSSVAGKIACSPLTPYMASKFALEALSEALAGEMKPFGVRVAIVEPGIIETAMPKAIADAAPSRYPHVRNFAALFRASLNQPVPPSLVGAAIRTIIESGTWQLRHPVGPDAVPFLNWRAGMTDEQWVDLNALDADGFRARIKKDFGLDLDLPGEDAPVGLPTAAS